MTRTLAALLSGIIDYASLFPPACGSMASTVGRYRDYRHSGQGWMLARLIVPAARLGEFEEATGRLPAEDRGKDWKLSVLPGADLDSGLKAVERFNRCHAGAAVIDSLEMKVEKPCEIETALKSCPDSLQPYFEVPSGQDPDPFLASLAATRGRVKIRTGGVTAEAIPSVDAVARFLKACACRGVAFKATAGLHHPLRGSYPLTYEKDSLQGVMHGFLNLFLAAALAHQGGSESDLQPLLEESRADAFRFDDRQAAWRGHRWQLSEIETVRRTFAHSYGSCSFEEPLEDLERIGLL